MLAIKTGYDNVAQRRCGFLVIRFSCAFCFPLLLLGGLGSQVTTILQQLAPLLGYQTMSPGCGQARMINLMFTCSRLLR